jgi:hypothetical protein
MSELLPNSERENDWMEYLELTRKQTGSVDWMPIKRARLQELEKSLDINQPTQTQEQKDALHRQGIADTRWGLKQELQPPLTAKERELIVEVNSRSLRSSR